MLQRQILLFGAPRIFVGGSRIALPRRKALALLAYLAATGTPHTRESLAALLWGESGEQSANAYLRNALWTLNKFLGADWADSEGGTVALNSGAVHTDVAAFTALAGEAMRADADRLKATGHAMALYTGEFMAGFTLPDAPDFTHWQMTTAESLRRTIVGVLMLRAESARAAGDLFAATDAAQRWLALDPLDERAARLMMHVLAEAGEVTAALRQYHDLKRRLRESLSAAPEPATVALFKELTPQPVSENELKPQKNAPHLATVTSEHRTVSPFPVSLKEKRLTEGETAIVGRDREREALAALLDAPDVRLISVIAPGGMGKTILARQTGIDADARGLFPDGVYWVSLAPLSGADVILSAIAAALPYPLGGESDLEARLFAALSDKRVLLVIDNFEHVLDGAPLVSALLAAASGVKILMTSRERLNLRGERVFDLHGLSVPRANADPLRTDSAAADLFVRRAQQATLGFCMTPQNAADIVRICRLVEGMPLALELAASWTPLLSCAEIAREIQTSLDFLTSPTLDIPERHRSLRAVFVSSWERMTADEQHVLARLAVFRGGFRLEAAQAVTGASPRVLLALVNKSLLKRREDGRFEIHELLRQFAEGMLDPEARLEAIDHHVAYFAALLAAENARMTSRDQRAALDTMHGDVDNIRSAWRHAVARRKFGALDSMIEPLMMFCHVRPRFDDLREMIAASADGLPADAERGLRAKLLIASASLQGRVHHQSVIDEMVDRASGLILPLADRPDMGVWLTLAGSLRRRPGRIQPEAETLIRAGLENLERQNHLWGIGYALYELGTLQHMQVRYAEARETLNRSLYFCEKVGQPWTIARVLEMLGENMHALGNYVAARDYMQRQIEPYRQLGMVSEIQRINIGLQRLDQRGALAENLSALLEGLAEMQAAGDRRGAAWARYNIAWLHYYEGDYVEAERMFLDCLRAFMALGDEEGMVWTNLFLAEVALETGRRAGMEPYLDGARRALAEMDFPWGESGLEYTLGNCALAEGDTGAARTHYCRAVETAFGVQSILQTLRHMAGIADIWARGDQPENALALATFIFEHPTTWDDTRRRAGHTIERLLLRLKPEAIAAAQASGRALTLADAVEMSLRML